MIRLEPMLESEFQIYRDRLIKEYAADKVKSGNWSTDESLKRSAQEIDQLLADGVKTRDHYLFSIYDDALAKDVGILWFAIAHWGSKDSAFIYDIEIDSTLRGHGYGTQALVALENQVKALGLNSIGLHVFGFNHRARALYEKLGYEITNINMTKKIS